MKYCHYTLKLGNRDIDFTSYSDLFNFLDDYFNKYHQIFNNPPQMKIVSIKNDILKSDPTYCHLEERIEILNNKHKELRNKINDCIQNANEIKSDKYKKYQQKYVALEKQVIDEIESKKKTISR